MWELKLCILSLTIAGIQSQIPSTPCDIPHCKLPDCRCSGVDIPGNLSVSQTPQFVLLTFDDAVTVVNDPFYEQAFSGRKNPDGCYVQATFFVSREYTDYSVVHKLYKAGHEIALHSITHFSETDYWRDASVETLTEEFSGERQLVNYFANIPDNAFKGIRAPFLQLSGNNSFQMMKNEGLKYDCSWTTQEFVDPPLWPYTLDYKSIQDCIIGPCPNEKFENIWVVPMIDWLNDQQQYCAMVDACQEMPDDVDGILQFFINNFDRHYKSNRAPFDFFVHAAWFQTSENHFTAYLKFLDYLQSLSDVYIVSISKMLEWVQNPSPINDFTNWPKCDDIPDTHCNGIACRLLKNGTEERWMTQCQSVCPKNYPWIGNPLGQ